MKKKIKVKNILKETMIKKNKESRRIFKKKKKNLRRSLSHIRFLKNTLLYSAIPSKKKK